MIQKQLQLLYIDFIFYPYYKYFYHSVTVTSQVLRAAKGCHGVCRVMGPSVVISPVPSAHRRTLGSEEVARW